MWASRFEYRRYSDLAFYSLGNLTVIKWYCYNVSLKYLPIVPFILILNTHSYSWPFLSFGVVFEEMWHGLPCPLSIILSIFFVLLALSQAYD